MNKLLIHSNNTSFNRTHFFSISEQFVFDVDFDKDVDFYIDDILSKGDLREKLEKSDVVFIKVALSQNYLEYLGLRLAYHIRLTNSLGEKAHIPIVFIAEESFQFLGLTYSEPSILYTGGIYLIKETMEDYDKVLRWIDQGKIKPLKDFDGFVNSINISPPANYQSHHSVANEWALARNFSMFEKDETNEWYNGLREKILDLDYLKTLDYKFTEAKASRQKFNPKKHSYTPIIKGVEKMRIGVIDDEIDKGWLAFYSYIFNLSNAEPNPFKGFRKDVSREELIKQIQDWILQNLQSTEPTDLFLIDLRLHDDDFSEQDFENLSGVQIIKFIKSKNQGIQIVVSTASNKVWNFQRCLEYGVRYYSIKESPETYNTREETRNTLVNLSKQITGAAEKSFLAGIYRDIQVLKANNLFIRENKEKEFGEIVFAPNGLLDQIFNLLILDSTSDAVINQCLLLCFQVIENYCDLKTVGDFGKDSSSAKRLSSGFVWSKLSGKKPVFINQPNQKISTLFELKYGRFDFQVEESNETPKSFKVFDKMEIISSYKSGIDASSLVRMITVLYFRESIAHDEIDKIIKLRYYRSNVAAHYTGKVKQGFKKITAEEISFFIQVFKQIFL